VASRPVKTPRVLLFRALLAIIGNPGLRVVKAA
jgi:hypothetical protein